MIMNRGPFQTALFKAARRYERLVDNAKWRDEQKLEIATSAAREFDLQHEGAFVPVEILQTIIAIAEFKDRSELQGVVEMIQAACVVNGFTD